MGTDIRPKVYIPYNAISEMLVVAKKVSSESNNIQNFIACVLPLYRNT